jgi:tRNA(fMet)-specific endonuclease VapC
VTLRPDEIVPTADLVVVDTDIVSFLFRRDTRAALYRPHLDGRLTIISAQTLAELEHWPVRRHWGERRRAELREALLDYWVQFPDPTMCRIYGEITAIAQETGFIVPEGDAWHAATALRLGVPLVTHNPLDFRGIPDLVVLTAGLP